MQFYEPIWNIQSVTWTSFALCFQLKISKSTAKSMLDLFRSFLILSFKWFLYSIAWSTTNTSMYYVRTTADLDPPPPPTTTTTTTTQTTNLKSFDTNFWIQYHFKILSPRSHVQSLGVLVLGLSVSNSFTDFEDDDTLDWKGYQARQKFYIPCSSASTGD